MSLAVLVCLGACATPYDVVNAERNIINNTNSVGSTLGKQNEKVIEGDLPGLKKLVEDEQKRSEDTAKKLDDAVKDAMEKERLWRRGLEALGGAAVTVSGAVGGPVGEWIAKAGDLVKGQGEFGKQLISYEAKQTQTATEVQAQKESIAAVRTDTQRIKDDLSALSLDLQKKVLSLSDTQKSEIKRIASETAESPDQMARARDDVLTYLRGQGFGEAQIAELKDMSWTKLLSLLLGTGAGATVLGGLAGKTGKSRAAKDIDGLRGELNDLRANMGVRRRKGGNVEDSPSS